MLLISIILPQFLHENVCKFLPIVPLMPSGRDVHIKRVSHSLEVSGIRFHSRIIDVGLPDHNGVQIWWGFELQSQLAFESFIERRIFAFS